MLAGDAEAGEEYVAGDPYTGSMIIIVSMMPPSEAPRELPRTPYRRSSQNFSSTTFGDVRTENDRFWNNKLTWVICLINHYMNSLKPRP